MRLRFTAGERERERETTIERPNKKRAVLLLLFLLSRFFRRRNRSARWREEEDDDKRLEMFSFWIESITFRLLKLFERRKKWGLHSLYKKSRRRRRRRTIVFVVATMWCRDRLVAVVKSISLLLL